MAVSLDSLITDVERAAASTEPLPLLATAAGLARELNDTADALLSHFVDRSRRAGHSWSEIGEGLGVTKQAVQKRYMGERQWLRGSELLTARARKTLGDHAEKAARELAQPSIGTEALLLAIWGEPKGIAAAALRDAGLDRKKTLGAINAVVASGSGFVGGYTPRAWSAMEQCITIAVAMGHNFIGTEHILIALLSGEDESSAVRALTSLGVSLESVTDFVKQLLGGIASSN